MMGRGMFATPGSGGLGTPSFGGGVETAAQAPRKRGGLFGSGVNAGDLLYALGGALGGDNGAAVGEIMARKERSRLEQQKLAMQEVERERERSEWLYREQWKLKNAPAGDNIDLREDNAGNMWSFDKRTGQPLGDKPVWVDRAPKTIVHDGMRIDVANPFSTPGGGSAVPTVSDAAGYEALPPGAQYRDPSGNLRTKKAGGPQASPVATFP